MAKLLTEYVDLSDVKLAFRQHGNGPTLILLHGNSESKKIFARYQTDYFKIYHTIAVDSRGHGESVSNDSEYSINQYSDDIIRLCEAKGIEQAYLIGYSDGGNISLFLAKKAPQIFRKIVAISPNYLVSGMTEGTLKLIKNMVKIFIFIGKLGINTKKSIMRFMLMLNDIGITDDELKSIQANMKILYAEKDAVKEEHIKQIADLISNCSIQKINHCKHLTILNKKETIEAIKQYLLE